MTTRRTFLVAGSGVMIAGLAGFGGSLLWCNRTTLASLPLERLDVALADMPWAARIGRFFRDIEGEVGVEAAFFARPALSEAMTLDCETTRRSALREVFRDEFRSGKVLTADGWVVSQAECVVAALRAV